MDVEVFARQRRPAWERLGQLAGRARSGLSGEEADELVTLYQLTATHLSQVRSTSDDPALVAQLSTLLARSRSAIVGTSTPAWTSVRRFFVRDFPSAVYGGRWWWASTALVSIVVMLAVGLWVAGSESVQASIAAPETIRQLVNNDFESYYSSNPAGSFAAQVATNNALIAAACLVLGVVLGIPVIYVLWQNSINVGISGGLMAANGKAGLFFGLILPHGLLELTAVFIAAGMGLRLGWTVVEAGRTSRGAALARQGRIAVVVAMGLFLTLLLSGFVEAFVTPSPLPTWARLGIGLAVETAFVTYVLVLGRRAQRAGFDGDVDDDVRGDSLPSVG